MKNSLIEVAFDRKNRDAWFIPLDRAIRGRFLLSRVAEPTAMSFRDKIPEEIPGQVLGLNVATAEGFLREPIHANDRVKSMIAKRDFTLEPELQSFPGVDVNAWLYWIKAAVVSGIAKVVKGELPEAINYEPPSRFRPRPKTGQARLREIFRQHPDTAAAYAGWSAEKRAEWEALVGV